MQYTHGPTIRLEIVITLLCSCYGFIEKDLGETVDTLLRNCRSLTKSGGDFQARRLPARH